MGVAMAPPLHLYKYRSFHSKKDKQFVQAALLDQELYFAQPTEFNDLFDCNLHIKATADPVICESRLRQLNPGMSNADIAALVARELSPERVAEIEHQVRDGVSRANAQIGILSLSAKSDDLLMWSHYADGHRGLCLEFAVRQGKLSGCDLIEVQYESQYPPFTVYDEVTLDLIRRHVSTN
jgi:hypothetical protein